MGVAILEKVGNHEFAEGEALTIIAHSHGGNAVKEYTKMEGARKIDTFVVLGTPHRDDTQMDSSMVGRYVNVWSEFDVVQPRAGGGDGPTSNPFLYGPAQQQTDEADINQEASYYRPKRSSKRGSPLYPVRHGQCRDVGCLPLATGRYGLNGPEVWRKYVAPIFK